MNVLICTPFGPHPHRIHPLTQQSINALGGTDVALETVGPVGNFLVSLCAKHNEARQLTLDGGYDALLHIDGDMVVPTDTVERLCATGADVAYGLYVMRQNPSQWLCWTYPNALPIADVDAVWGKQIRSLGAGMGCTLIRRHVLESLAFRTDGIVGSDWDFAQDCANYGFTQVHDLGCVCGHIDGDKVLYPDPTVPEFYRVEMI